MILFIWKFNFSLVKYGDNLSNLSNLSHIGVRICSQVYYYHYGRDWKRL